MSLPLRYFLTADRCVGVRFHCWECGGAWDVTLQVAIADLQGRGLGGPETPLHDVAGFARKPCPKCGGRNFVSRPAWR